MEVHMVEFETSKVQMIFAAFSDSVTIILLQPIVQRACSIMKPSEENSKTNPSITYKKSLESRS